MPSLPFEDEDLPLFTVGQVSGMLEVQQAFLRRLDEFGVVRPSRSGGGQRRYSRREIVTVQYVVRLTSEGMTLAAVRRILELEAQVRDLELQIAELRAQLRYHLAEAARADQAAGGAKAAGGNGAAGKAEAAGEAGGAGAAGEAGGARAAGD